jgi:hypothetical protein
MIAVFKSPNEQELMEKLQVGSHRVNTVIDVDYYDLVKAFGQPSLPKKSPDGKVQKEWILEHNGNIYTIYDWKTNSESYTRNELTSWNIGGTIASLDFLEELKSYLPPYASFAFNWDLNDK